ncbi:magnesium chelatase subunit D [Litoreibacter roseus]|uniref:Magnesium-chelatase 60 kDa subunit n=1 Tax=Litoreibacter roseus TaxID=2601869 RepID=A0A6N6JE29_9RHOB|nr:magnesium chelatase subunit D [Litoreibacter roseus]GFE64601.1 magnesium-chelatase 60 kDa subunit [Litoreibacter roseus]
MTERAAEWETATAALTLLAIDPAGLGGIWLRAKADAPRDRLIAAVGPAMAPRPLARLHPNVSDDQLFGGLDLTQTLDLGRTVLTSGLLGREPSVLMLSMAERCPAPLAARLGQSLDGGQGHSLLALDESDDDEMLPPALQDRLAFHLDLNGLSHRNTSEIILDHDSIEIARIAYAKLEISADLVAQAVETAFLFGVVSTRAVLFAIRAARALAALQRNASVTEAHLAQAMALVIAPRAIRVPDLSDAPAPQESASPEGQPENQTTQTGIPEDIVLQAVAAALPKNVLQDLKTGAAKATTTGSSGAGAKKRSNRRGKPKPSIRGRLGGAARLDLIATLRRAAPWQKIRAGAPYAPDRTIHIRAEDLCLKRFEEKSDRLLIFAVDASGSAALARMAEAKGAVELLLAEAYARRDQVALIAFRGTDAELLLPPTRSLVQTKRRLSALPGGGGTPLATGLEAAFLLALSTKSKGMTPTIALLTDGRANIALDGSANRGEAQRDASKIARLIREKQTPALVIDTGTRPQAALKDLAHDLGAPYLPLPRANAHGVSQAIEAVLE